MRVVVDTNVLVSGVINPHGAPGRVLDAVLAGTLMILHEDRIISEYREVLTRPVFGFRRDDIDTLVDFIEQSGERITAQPLSVVLPDPTDLPFLEVAISGRADALITGNVKHFKPRRGHHRMDIDTPAQFLMRLARHSG